MFPSSYLTWPGCSPRLLVTLLAARLLRRLKQLGFTDYFFHSAEHTRL